ncbi:MAG: metallophosphoesterase family protein, partial [Pseudomonadota bacterium]
LVHLGLPEEIETAVEWLESLGPPSRVMLVPGNHDVYAGDSGEAVLRHWADYVAGAGAADNAFPRIRRLGETDQPVSVIGLSSAVVSPLFMAYGRLGAQQFARLDRALEDAAGFRCLMLHHPPLPGMVSRRKGLQDAPALARLLAHRRVDVVLHGHVHRNGTREGPGGARVLGTASASSVSAHAPACYRRLDVTPADGGGWTVDMRLIMVTADGGRTTLERLCWHAPGRDLSAGR